MSYKLFDHPARCEPRDVRPGDIIRIVENQDPGPHFGLDRRPCCVVRIDHFDPAGGTPHGDDKGYVFHDVFENSKARRCGYTRFMFSPVSNVGDYHVERIGTHTFGKQDVKPEEISAYAVRPLGWDDADDTNTTDTDVRVTG